MPDTLGHWDKLGHSKGSQVSSWYITKFSPLGHWDSGFWLLDLFLFFALSTTNIFNSGLYPVIRCPSVPRQELYLLIRRLTETNFNVPGRPSVPVAGWAS